MAISIREYVQTYFSQTYASVGDNLDAYRALAYMGLQNSQLYYEKVIQTGKETSFNSYRASLSAQVQGHASSDIPLQVVPVTPLDPLLPFAEQQGMHFPGEEVGQGKTLDIKGEGTQ